VIRNNVIKERRWRVMVPSWRNSSISFLEEKTVVLFAATGFRLNLNSLLLNRFCTSNMTALWMLLVKQKFRVFTSQIFMLWSYMFRCPSVPCVCVCVCVCVDFSVDYSVFIFMVEELAPSLMLKLNWYHVSSKPWSLRTTRLLGLLERFDLFSCHGLPDHLQVHTVLKPRR